MTAVLTTHKEYGSAPYSERAFCTHPACGWTVQSSNALAVASLHTRTGPGHVVEIMREMVGSYIPCCGECGDLLVTPEAHICDLVAAR
jgi:hypothetical protein